LFSINTHVKIALNVLVWGIVDPQKLERENGTSREVGMVRRRESPILARM
jgi:hypothetical protein